jgi:MFS family permease
MDVALYSIGSFQAIILATMAFSNHTGYIDRATAAAHGSAFIDIFLVVGIIIAILLVDTWGRIKLQAIGFLGMAIGLMILAFTRSMPADVQIPIIFIGFILFFLSANAGPNPTTFLLPAEMFPTHIRATGHGFASAAGKVGAAVGIFFLPVLNASIGLPSTMVIISGACLLGFIMTTVLGHETKGKSLDELEERVEEDMNEAEVGLLVVQGDMQRLNADIKRVEGALSKAIEEMRRLRQQNNQNQPKE